MSRYIRLRGLPWQATPEEILDFFKGVNIVDGVNGIHLVTSKADGKNTGEAFVLLESEQDEEEAFKHNKETLGHRYIEIFSATNEEAEYAMRRPIKPSLVVKLRGLPYTCTEDMIMDFFDGLEIKRNRLLIVTDRRGRATGEAYVQFLSKEDTENALKLNREKIGHRYIEIFRSTMGEMKRQNSNTSVGPYDRKDRGGSRGGDRDRDFGRGGRSNISPRDIWATNGGGGSSMGGGNNMGGGNSMGGGGFNSGGGGGRFDGGNSGGGGGGGGGFGDFNNFGNNRNSNPFSGNSNFDGPFNSNRNSGGGGGNGGNFGNNIFGSGLGGSGGGGGGGGGGGNSGSGMNDNMRSNSMIGGSGFGPVGGARSNGDLYCVHMRGLPYFCFENDVYRFFEPLRPLNVKIIYNTKGLHSGTADAYFDNKEDAMVAMKKHREQMGNRYIELFFDGQTNKGSDFTRRI